MTSFWDKYSSLKSPIHRISPHIKMILSFSFILLLAILPLNILIWVSPISLILLISIIYISKVPIIHILRRAFLIMPIIIPVILINTLFRDEIGILVSLILLRSFLSILILIMLVSTTKFNTILITLDNWHFPGIFLIILSFMYRYFFLLIDELEKMIRSVKLRSCNKKKLVLFKSYTNIMGVLMIKSFDRAERVFQAMEMRGFEDNWRIK